MGTSCWSFWRSGTYFLNNFDSIKLKDLKMSAFDMGPAVRPSALIKTTRWSLLLVGIWYGHKRYNQLLAQEDEIRAYNARMKPIWDKEKAEKAAKLNREKYVSSCKGSWSHATTWILSRSIPFSSC